MHYSEIYADERASREMEAAAQSRMGCCPLGRMISRVTMNCNGREGRMRNERMDYAKAYPHAQTCYVRPTARTVTVSTTNHHHHANAHAIPPERPQTHTTLPGTPFAAGAPPARAGAKPRKKKKSKRVRFTPEGPVAPARFTPAGPVPFGPAPPPHGPHAQQHAEAGTSSAAASGHHHHDHPGGAEPYSSAVHGPGPGYGYDRYVPSPLTRWEMLGTAGTPRRYEYFSGEYRWCYPTPVREGIYYIATDANRLTTIFSEENPNACTIV